MQTIKCVLVGDSKVGKTWLITTYVNNRTPETYVSTLFDNFRKDFSWKNKLFKMSIWDTAGCDEFGKLRSLSYLQTDVFIVCFALNNPDSFNNARSFVDNLQTYSVPIILCGTKCDLKDEECVDRKTIENYLSNNKMYEFIETSSSELINVNRVFELAVEAVVDPQKDITANNKYCGTKAKRIKIPGTDVTHEWVVYVKAPKEIVKSVQYKLHESFQNNVILTEFPFELREQGWGEFTIQIKITLFNDEKLHTSHFLKLHGEGEVIVNEVNDEIVYRGIETFTEPNGEELEEYNRIDACITHMLGLFKDVD